MGTFLNIHQKFGHNRLGKCCGLVVKQLIYGLTLIFAKVDRGTPPPFFEVLQVQKRMGAYGSVSVLQKLVVDSSSNFLIRDNP